LVLILHSPRRADTKVALCSVSPVTEPRAVTGGRRWAAAGGVSHRGNPAGQLPVKGMSLHGRGPAQDQGNWHRPFLRIEAVVWRSAPFRAASRPTARYTVDLATPNRSPSSALEYSPDFNRATIWAFCLGFSLGCLPRNRPFALATFIPPDAGGHRVDFGMSGCLLIPTRNQSVQCPGDPTCSSIAWARTPERPG
jgi:hypothetical protein